jgi:hypothetical protein
MYYASEIIESIIHHTNNVPREAQDPSKPNAQANWWYPTFAGEIYLLAIKIYMTLISLLEIPKGYNDYNYKMLPIDIADQLAGSNSGRRRIRRGAWQAIEQWLLVTVFVNSYLVALYSKVDRERQIK